MSKLSNPSGNTGAQGSYAGDNTANRAIPHGMGGAPRFIAIQKNAADELWIMVVQSGKMELTSFANSYNPTTPTPTNFYVGKAATFEGNVAGQTYFWYAVI
jgi:hypothetical protein